MTSDERQPPPPPTLTNVAGRRLEAGERLADRYRIVEMLGLGAMGIVYRAKDEELDVDVAVKVLRPELADDQALIERFRRELILARQVSHRNVVRIHDLGRDGDLLFLTMDFVDGQTLRDALVERDGLAVEEVVRIGTQLARALAAAHERDIVHRDLKPSNVMLDTEGNAYITDFGIARSLSSAALTRTGLVMGTPGYLAPEQIRGEQLDGRCDIFALGVLLRELLEGEQGADSTADELLARSMSGTALPLDRLRPEVPANLRAILQRALEPDRKRRYASAAAMADDLEGLTRPSRRRPARRTLAAVAGVLLVLAALALGFPAARRWLAAPPAATEGTAPVARLPTIAVLPFADETEDAETAWLGAGIPELLFESLVSHPGLRVVDPQRVVSALADLRVTPGTLTGMQLEQAAELFDAERIVTGSVRSAGRGLRIEARLITPGAGAAAALPLAVVDAEGARSAAELVGELETELLEKLTLPAHPTREPEALASAALPAYSVGIRQLQEGEFVAARARLEEAADLDPGFGPALLGLSHAYEALGMMDEAAAAVDRAVDALPAGRRALAARAAQARLAGDPERSTELLAELVERYPADLESSVDLAEAYALEGRFGEAVEALQAVVEVAPNHPRAWYLLAKFSILSGESRRAVDEYLVRAMVIQNKLKNPQGQADVLNAYGVAYRELGEMEQAEESYRRAAELRRDVGDQRGYATTLRNLSQIAIFRGNYADAESDLLTARSILAELGDEAGIADVHNELGMMEEARGRYAESLEQFRQALQRRRRLGDRRAIAESLNNIGFANHELGNYDDAAVYWGQALDIYKETANLEGQVAVRQSLGQLQTTRGDWAEGTQTFLEALTAARQLEWTAAVAAAEGSLGRLAHYQGRFAAALGYLDEALASFDSIEDPRGYLEFGLARAAVQLDLGRADQALALLAELEERLDAVGGSGQRATFQRLRAESLHRSGDGGDAVSGALAAAAAAAADSGNRALQLAVELAQARTAGNADELGRIYDELLALGNARLELQAGEAQVARLLALGEIDRAASRLGSVRRTLRRVGAYEGAQRIYRLAERLAVARDEDPATWRERAASELERLQDQSPELASVLARRGDDGGPDV